MANNPAAPGTWRLAVDLPSERGSNRQVTDELLAQLDAHGWPEADVFAVHLAVEEAIVNAIVHGNKLDPAKKVHVVCEVSSDRVLVSIADEGPGFDPTGIPDCTADDRLEAPGGRGVMLMRSFMTRIEYNPAGNAVVLEKQRHPAES
ncbi:MAG: ATP-binding protein [Planctomycetaceae bacterium]